MSRTDKTRPFHVKQDELRQADPYGYARDPYQRTWRPEFRCGHSCRTCGDREWYRNQKRRDRQQGKKAAQNWD